MCDCFHLAFPNWHAASSGTGGRRLRGPEAATEDDSVSDSTCDEPAGFTGGERPRPQGSSPVEEFPETEKYTDSDKECEGEHDRQNKTGSGKKTKKSGLGSMFEKRSTPKMNKLKELPIPESAVIVKTAKDGCAEGLVYGGGGKDGIFIKGVVPESPASKSLKLKEGDQVLSATVYFDNVSYEDAIQILEHAQAYKMKLCLKRKPDISQTDAPNQSDVIPEDDVYAPEMREQGKTKRHGDSRISWPKFPSFGKGRKAHFKRSHSSSEAEEQRKLELSPTTSDTESPIKSQDALKGRKKNKMKLSVLTKRGRISSSEDQDTNATGQISSDVQHTQESDMLSPECLESPSGDAPKVYVSKDEKSVGDLRPEQNNQTLTESGTPSWKAELISIDSTLKTTDLTVALANQDSQTGVKSPEGKKKKKKEKSELKLKILGKDQSHKKAKSSPKRLKTLGASLEVSDQNDAQKSDVAQIESTKMDLRKPKVELDSSDVDCKQKGKEKTQKSNQKQAKAGAIIKLPQVGLGDATNEETIQQVSVNVEEYKPKTELLTASGAEVKVHSYDKLLKDRISSTQLPKREDIEIPGMEDKSAKTKVKGVKESKRHHEETVQMSIDVDSVKEAVSKLPGYKLPKVDTSGMPIPEEITVIDANAQRISVKTPTKIVDTKTKHETHFTKFDANASQDSSKTTIKLPRMRAADLTTQELLFETRLDAKKTQKQHKEIKTGAYEREDIIIPGRETTTHSFDRTSDGIKGEKTIYLQDIKISETETMTDQGWIRGFVSDVKIPEIDGIEFIDSTEGSPAKKDAGVGFLSFDVNLDANLKSDASIPEIISEIKDVKAIEHTVQMPKCGELTTDISVNAPGGDINMDRSENKSHDSEGKRGKFKMPSFGISFSKVKEPQTGLSPSKKDATVTLPEAKAEIKCPQGINTALESVMVSPPGQKIDTDKPQLDIKQPQIEGELDAQGNKFKMPQFQSPTLNINMSKTDGHVKVENTEAKVKLPKAPEVALTLGSVGVFIPEHKSNVEKTAMETKQKIEGKIRAPEAELKAQVEITAPEIKDAEKDAKGSPLKFKMPTFKLPKFEVGAPNISVEKPDVNIEATDIKIPKKGLQGIDVDGLSIDIKGNELEGKGDKFKIPSLGFSKPKGKGPKFDFSLSKKEVDVTLPKTDQVEKGVSLPDVKMKMPQAEVKRPEMNLGVKTPEFEAESDGHEGKFKKTKFGIKLPKVKGPEFDFSLSKGEVNVKFPETQDKLPEVDPGTINVSLPDSTIEVNKPELQMQPLEIEGQQGDKFKMPSFGIKMPKTKGIEIDMSQSKKDPGVKTSQSDVTVGKVELEEQESKLKMPKFGVSMPKVKGPDIHVGLSKKDAEVTAPEVKADVKLEALSAQIEMKAPQIDTVASSSQFTMPDMSFSMQKIKGTDVHFTLPKTDVKLPVVEAEAKPPEAPEIYVKLGRSDVSLPDAKMKLEKPELDVKMTGIEGEGKESKFKVPKFGISLPKFQGPEIDFNLSKRDVKLPEAKVDVKLPKASGVDTDLGNVVVSIPQTKSEIKQPELEIKPLEVEGELEGSKFKVPKFGIKMSEIKGPKFDVSMSKREVKLPEAEVKLPEAPEIDVRLGSVDVSLSEAKMKLGKPELEIKPLKTEAELDGQGSKFKMPKFGVTMAKVKGPDVDVKLPEVKADVKLPDVEVKKPSAEVEIKAPEIKVGSKDTKASPLKIKMPMFKLPKFGVFVPGVSAEEPDVDKDIEIKGPDIKTPEEVLTVHIEAPKIDAKALSIDIKTTEMKHEDKSGKFKVPSLGFKGSEVDVHLQKTDVALPEVKAVVKLPDVEVKKLSGEVEVKSPELKRSTKDKKGSPSKFKMPSFKMPKLGFGTPSVSAETPDVKIPEEILTVNIKAPSIEAQAPTVHIKTKEIELEGKGGKFKAPSLLIKGPDIEISEKDVKIPDVKAEVEVPVVGVDVKAPNAGETGGKFKMPEFGITMPKIKGPDFNSEKKDVTLQRAGAEVDLPHVELKGPSAEVEGSKFNLPTVTLPKLGAAAKTVGDTLTMPTGKATVNVEAPNIDLKAQYLDVKMTGIEGEGKESKFKVPKFGISLPKVPGHEIDFNLSKRDVKLPEAKVDVKLPKASGVDTDLGNVVVSIPQTKSEIKQPELEIKPLEVEGELEGSKFKVPKFGIKMSEIKGPKFDVSMSKREVKLPEAEVKLPEAPEIDVRLGSVDVSLSEAKMKLGKPELEIKPLKTEAELDGQGSKFKMPKFGVTMAKVKGPDVDVKLPEVKADVKLPAVEVKKPSAEVEIKSPEFKLETKDTDGSPSKFKMPTFKMPKFGGGSPSVSVDVPDVDKDVKLEGADIKIPEEVLTVNIEAPNIKTKGPTFDIKMTESEPEKRGSKFKFPSLGFKGPEIDLSVSKKDVDVKLPGVKAEVKLPDVEVKKPSAEVEIKSPGINLKTSDVEGSPSKIKLPTFKFPKFGVGSPQVSVEGPDMDKDMKLEGADLKIKGAKAEVKLPDVEVKEPAGSISIPQAPEVDAESKSRKTSWTMPRFSFSKASVKAPEAEINLEAPKLDVSIPEGTVEVKQPEGDVQLDGQKGKFKFPSLGFKGPEIDLSVSKKDVDVKLPEVKADVKLPAVEVKKPSAEVEIKSPEFKLETKDTDGSPSKFKMPTFKMPKFGGGSPSVSVDVPDVDKDVKLEGADIKIPEEVLTVNIEAPNIKTKGPTFDIKMTESEPEKRGSKFKFPSLGFKGPEIDLSVSKKDVDVKLPGVKAEVKLPDVEVKKPSAEVEIKSPGIDLKTSDVEGSPSKIKLPTFKFPKFGVGSPQVSVEGPDMDKDMKLEGADLKIKGAKAEVKLPDVEVKEPAGSISIPQAPEVDAESKSRKTSWTMPRFSFSKASVKAPEAEINLEAPKLDVSIPEGTVEVKQPEGDVQLDGQKGKFKFPSLGFKGPEIDLSVSKKDVDVKLPEVKADVKLKAVEVKKPSAEVEIKSPEFKLETKDTDGSPSKFKMPTFKMPKFGGGSPSLSVDVPDVDKDVKLEGADIKIPEEVLTVNIEAPNIKTKGPTFDIKMTESEPEKRGSKFKFPSLGFKGPEIDLSVSKKDVDVKLPGVKAEVKLPDVEVKKPSAEVEIKSPGIDLKTSDVQGSPSKFKMPTFKMPKFGGGAPNVTAEIPDMDKDVKIEGADINVPEEVLTVNTEALCLKPKGLSIDIETKEPEQERKGNKFKFPSLGFKGPELDISKKDVEVKLPEVKAEVKLPDVEVKKPSAEVEIKSPGIDLKTSDVEGSPSKIKLPTFKFPKFGVGSPQVSVEGPDMDKDMKLEGADLKIKGAKAEVKLPDVEVKEPAGSISIPQAPEVDAESKSRKTSWTMPRFSFSKASVKAPEAEINLEAPKLDVSIPEGTVEVKQPEGDVQLDGQKGKFKFPSLGFKGPEIDLSVSKKDVDVKLPEVKADVKLPAVEVKKPSAEVEIKSPEFKLETKDTDGSPSKFKMPTFKMPKFGGGSPSVSVDVPDVDKDVKLEGADIKIPEEVLTVNIEAPNIKTKGPTFDIKMTESEPEKRGSKFKFPSLGFKGPEIDLSVSKKDVDVKLPEVKAEVKLPDVEVKKPSTEVEIKSPGIDLKTSDVQGSPSKFKMPTFKMPKFGVGSPQVSVEGPDMDKDMKLEGADLKIKGAKAEVKLPDVEVKEPAGSISIPQAPEVDAESKSRKTSWTMPRFSFSKASVKAPEAEINLEAPKLDVSIPEGTVEVKQPEGDVQLDGQKGKFKFPSLGFKGPEIDLSVSKKDVDVKLPEVKADVKLPAVEVKKPSAGVEIKSPEFKLETKDTDGSPSKFKMPTFKMPKFGGGSPSVSVDVPDVDKDVKLEGADIKIPEEVLTVNIEAPNIKTKGPTFDIKMTESVGSGGKLPSFGISASKVKGPEIDLSLSKKDVTLPEVTAEVQLPDNEVKDNDPADSEAKAKWPGWTFPKLSFSKSSGKVSDANFNPETPKVNVAASDAKAEFCLPDVEVKQSAMKVEVRPPESKIKSAEIGIEKLKISQKDVNIILPELKLSEGEVKGIEAKSKDVGRSPLKFKIPTMTMLKLGGATQDSTTETPSAEQVAQIEDIKLQQDMTVTLKCPSVDIKTEASKAATSGSETPKDEPDSVELGSPSKFKLPSFKMPMLSFSRTKSEEENIPADTKHGEHEEEVKVETKEVIKSPKLSSFGNILKTIDVEFDVPEAEKVEDKFETSKEPKKHDEAPGQQVDQEMTKSPESTGWFSFRFGLSSPSEAPKASQENEQSPAGESGDDGVSPSCSVQSSDAFADISSTVTSELIGPLISSPTKVTVKYSDPDSAVGPGDIQSNIITSMARTELISDMPNLPEKITILSSGVSSSSEDTLRLESGKIHVFTSNIQATPESQHARLLTAVQVQPSTSVSLTSEAKEASSWTMKDTQDGIKTVFERRLAKETSSERSESTETIVITKQISHVFQSSEPISGETASSIQRLRDTVHSDKMKFFDETEK